METPRDNYELALAGAALGKRFIPCTPGEKVPLVKWKQYREVAPTPELYERWFKGTRNGIALLTDGMVLFDCDDPAKVPLVLEQCGDTPHRIRSPRGGEHLGYRRREGVEVGNRVRIKGEAIDIRTDGGLELWPFSWTADGKYEFVGNPLVPMSALPVAKIGWTRERTRKRVVQSVEPVQATDFMEYRATRWLERVAAESPAVSGQGGHNATFRVAIKLTHYFGLSRDAAIRLLLTVYNPHCVPPWSEHEIAHKVDDALKRR